jgi:hypothetical protein
VINTVFDVSEGKIKVIQSDVEITSADGYISNISLNYSQNKLAAEIEDIKNDPMAT